MLKKLTFAGAALAMTAAAVVPAAPAAAQSYRGGYYGRQYQQPQYQGYYDNGGYRTYRGYDNRYASRNHCNSDRGTVIGAIAGGLLGNVVAGRGDRLLGTVIGGAAGALAGREVARSGQPGYCR